MSDAAIPVTLAGEVYHLRYTYPDFKKMEFELGMGYTNFPRDEILRSLTAIEVHLWCGLKKEDSAGKWLHVFPQTPEGKEQAGALLWDHLRTGGSFAEIVNAVMESFVETGPWKRADPKKPKEPEKKQPKNSKT